MMSNTSPRKVTRKHEHLPEELREAIRVGAPVSYDFYMKHRAVYSTATMKVLYDCSVCGAPHLSNFKHLNKRTRVSDPLCPKCVMGAVTSDDGWKRANSNAQLKVQSLPEVRAKNAAGVSRFWRENPERLEAMRARVLAAQQTSEVKDKYKARQAWNGRGISGDYLSKWGWLTFDSSYELALLVALEKRDGVKAVRRGPTIEYVHEGVVRQFFVDFEITFVDGKKWWCEVKSGYVGTRRDKLSKLRSKLGAALDLVRQGHADKIVMVTEKNSGDLFNVKMPRGTYRTAMFKSLYDKIIFSNQKHEERFK